MNVLTAFFDKSAARAALMLALGMAAVVGAALLFQYVGGYMPCKLCLEQRTPYYLGAPLMLLAALTANGNRQIARWLLAIGGLLMLYGLTIAVFHAGVEWSWWAGPTDCTAVSTSGTTDAGTLLDDLNAIHPPSCDKAAIRILGLSMAGWNVPASLVLMLVAFRAAWKA
jgi:disulfide bond formation protein DsbB